MDSDPMETTLAFLYLSHTVAYNNRNWEALYQNIRESQWRWGMMAKLLMNVGAAVQAQDIIYKAVVHTVLLYGSER